MILLVKIFAIIFAWTLIQGNNQKDKLFFLQRTSGKDKETFLVVTWTEDKEENPVGCEIFRDKDLINEVLKSSTDSPIRTFSGDEMQLLLEDCTEFILRRRRREAEEDNEALSLDDVINYSTELAIRKSSGQQNNKSGRTGNNASRTSTSKPSNGRLTTNVPTTNKNGSKRRKTTIASRTRETTTNPPTTLGYDGLPIIYPGTKWCGAGDIAQRYTDLGTYQDTDRCCRAHDNCNDTLAPGETRYNLTNRSSFTKLSCKCDEEFYDCLSNVNTFTSNSIGNMYFNILRRDCYKREYPLTRKCKRYLTLLKITCMEYERNTTAPKVYQWIPAQRYKNAAVPG